MKTLKQIGLATTGALIVASGLIASPAFAQVPETYPAWVTRLAEQTGRSAAEIWAEAREAHEQRLADEVAAGRLTAEQAEALRARFDQGGLALGTGPWQTGSRGWAAEPGAGWPGQHVRGPLAQPAGPQGPQYQGPSGQQLRGPRGAMSQPGQGYGPQFQGGGWFGLAPADRGPEQLAAFLGLTAEDLQAAHQAGKSLADIAAEQGKTREQVTAYLLARQQASLDAAVQAGWLTPEQAAERQQLRAQNIDRLLDGTGPIGPQRGARAAGQPWWAK